ncbi:TIGR04076 family protein [Spirochaetota bacterium]
MSEEEKTEEMDESIAKVLEAENRYYQEVTITSIDGQCPYGHKVGDKFKVTTMNGDGICGSLLKSIFYQIATFHYGGEIMWEQEKGVTTGSCAEGGRVKVDIRRVEQDEKTLLKTPFEMKDMTGKGYKNLDKYRIFVEVIDIAVNCYWGHKVDDVFELDPFNMGGACCFLYNQLYQFIHVLASGASPPWAGEELTVIGECPDTYDRLMYRLYVKER